MTDFDSQARVTRVIEGLQAFADEMHAKGIHVGIGSPPICAACRQDWPCAHERRGQRPTDVYRQGNASDNGKGSNLPPAPLAKEPSE